MGAVVVRFVIVFAVVGPILLTKVCNVLGLFFVCGGSCYRGAKRLFSTTFYTKNRRDSSFVLHLLLFCVITIFADLKNTFGNHFV